MKKTESSTQIACVKWFNLQYPKYKRLLFAVPNGGARNKITGTILKKEGVMSGVSDLILMIKRDDYGALCIEMKSKTGSSSKNQKEWRLKVEAQGYKYIICRTVDEFIKEINSYVGLDDLN